MSSPRISSSLADLKDGKMIWDKISSYSHQATAKKRKGHTMVSYKNRLYIFGGFSGTVTGDFWVYFPDANKWKRLDVPGTVPSKRTGHSACMFGSKMIIFGGDSGGNEILNDLWEIDLSQSQLQWKRIYPQEGKLQDGPRPRYAHSSVVIGDLMVTFGGYGGMYLDECWRFDLVGEQGWSRIVPQHSSPDGRSKPSRRCYHSAISLPLDDAMLIYGGSNGQCLNDIWWLHLPTQRWKQVIATTPRSCSSTSNQYASLNELLPVPRAKHAFVRVFGDHLLIHGGTTGLFREADMWLFRVTTTNITLDNKPLQGQWTRLETPQNAHNPVARDSHTIVTSNGDKDLWLFGGSGKGTYFNDMWHCILDRNRDAIAAATDSPPKKVHFSENNLVVIQPEDKDNKEPDFRSFHFFDEYQRQYSPRQQELLRKQNKTWYVPIEKKKPIEHEKEHDGRNSMEIVEDEVFSQLSKVLRIEEMKHEKETSETQLQQTDSLPDQGSKSIEERLQRYEKMILEENKRPEKTNSSFHSLERNTKTQKEKDVEQLIEELSALKQDIVASEKIISPRKNNSSIFIENVQSDQSTKIKNEQLNKKNDLEEKILRVERQVRNRDSEDDEFKKKLEIKLMRLEQVMQRQGDAIESLSQVINREIQSRVAGENRSQSYYQLLSQQIANQIQVQTKRFQMSVNQLSDVVSKLK